MSPKPRQRENVEDLEDYAEGLCCLIVFGSDKDGQMQCLVHDDALERDDVRLYFKMARFVLNSHYRMVTKGKNCPLRDDGPAGGTFVDGMKLDHFIVLGVESKTATSMKLAIPEMVSSMSNFPDYLERAINALDHVMAARRLA